MVPVVKQALRSAWWGTIAGVGALVIGLAVFLVYALSEVLAHPGLSLEDGYWIGRLPWTGIGEGLTVIGVTVAVVLGTLTVWLGGTRWRRALVLVPLASAVFFWFVATPFTDRGFASVPVLANIADLLDAILAA